MTDNPGEGRHATDCDRGGDTIAGEPGIETEEVRTRYRRPSLLAGTVLNREVDAIRTESFAPSGTKSPSSSRPRRRPGRGTRAPQ